jgi:hypothetical protein
VARIVRCYPKSGQILQRSEMTRSAISDIPGYGKEKTAFDSGDDR